MFAEGSIPIFSSVLRIDSRASCMPGKHPLVIATALLYFIYMYISVDVGMHIKVRGQPLLSFLRSHPPWVLCLFYCLFLCFETGSLIGFLSLQSDAMIKH